MNIINFVLKLLPIFMLQNRFVLTVNDLFSGRIGEACQDIESRLSLHPNTNVIACRNATVTFKVTNGYLQLKVIVNNMPNNFNYLLNLNRTDDLLANANTTVWVGRNNNGTITTYEKSTIKTLAPNISNFQMYHNYTKKAAVIIFNRTDYSCVEGFFYHILLRCVKNKLQTGPDRYIAIRILTDLQGYEKNARYTDNSQVDLKIPDLNIINIPLTIAVGPSSKNRIDEELKTILLYFNAVDMLLAQFKSPKILLSIKGIITPQDSNASPYLMTENSNNSDFMYYDKTGKLISNYFKSKRSQFNLNSHDFVLAMTNLPIYTAKNANDQMPLIQTEYFDQFCNKTWLNNNSPTILGLNHPNFQGGYGALAWFIIASLGNYSFDNCGQHLCCDGNSLKESVYNFISSLEWPKCTQNKITATLKSKECVEKISELQNMEYNQLHRIIKKAPVNNKNSNNDTIIQNWLRFILNIITVIGKKYGLSLKNFLNF